MIGPALPDASLLPSFQTLHSLAVSRAALILFGQGQLPPAGILVLKRTKQL